jgi:hypothetical protein
MIHNLYNSYHNKSLPHIISTVYSIKKSNISSYVRIAIKTVILVIVRWALQMGWYFIVISSKKVSLLSCRNISRDFSDAGLMAEIIAQYFPALVDIHNYPTTNSVKNKLENWKTLNNKTLSKLGIKLKQ